MFFEGVINLTIDDVQVIFEQQMFTILNGIPKKRPCALTQGRSCRAWRANCKPLSEHFKTKLRREDTK